jgi:hypothetical protein
MAMSLKMARWIDAMGAASDRAARLVWDGKGDELVILPFGTECPGAQHDDGVTALAAIDLLRALVADHEGDSEDPEIFSAPEGIA